MIHWTLYFDGGCQPCNPGGVATYGWTLLNAEGGEECCGSGVVCSGEGATNNVSEYTSLIRGLEHIAGCKLNGLLRIRGDSKLVVMTVAGKWRCRKSHLWKLLRRIKE